MDLHEEFHRLDLDHDAFGHQQIEAISSLDDLAVIDQRQRQPPLVGKPYLPHFMGETSFVRALEQAGSQGAMDCQRQPNSFSPISFSSTLRAPRLLRALCGYPCRPGGRRHRTD